MWTFLHLFIILGVRVLARGWVTLHSTRENNLREGFSPSPMWVPGMKLGLSALATGFPIDNIHVGMKLGLSALATAFPTDNILLPDV